MELNRWKTASGCSPKICCALKAFCWEEQLSVKTHFLRQPPFGREVQGGQLSASAALPITEAWTSVPGTPSIPGRHLKSDRSRAPEEPSKRLLSTASSPRRGMETNVHGPPGGLAAHKPTFPNSNKQKPTASTNQRPGRAPPTRCEGASRAAGVWRHPRHPSGMIQSQGRDWHRATRHKLPEAQISAQQSRGDCKQLTRPWKAKPWLEVAHQRTSDCVETARSTTIHQTAQHPLCLERSSPTTLAGSTTSPPHTCVHTHGQTTTHPHPPPPAHRRPISPHVER